MNDLNIALEFHDSTWARADTRGSDLVITLSPAFLHESAGQPGTDSGTGYWQDVRIVLREAGNAPSPAELPVRLRGGTLKINSQQHDNVVRLPVDVPGGCKLSLTLEDGSTFQIEAARGITIDIIGVPTGMERFPGV